MRRYRLSSFHVIQAYLQITTNLARPFYIRPPRELPDAYQYLLRIRKALYGLSDSGDYWHHTLDRTKPRDVGLVPSIGDQALYCDSAEPGHHMQGMGVTQVDYVLGTGCTRFHNRTLQLEAQCDCNRRETRPLTSAGVTHPSEGERSRFQHRLTALIFSENINAVNRCFLSPIHRAMSYISPRSPRTPQSTPSDSHDLSWRGWGRPAPVSSPSPV